ncbi:Rne/Rng family ribonuclease [Psychrobacter sanguinis]|uniref:Rne/Rng family ribonuclease n=1 Tax=Psychrobacter sanguinis TaxID=861445 RepID=UPI001918BCA4|nr:Rne/Rng family ribonuclease [Psychrobacter sanguinis]MCC3308575.1 Rne/Rng family ribonuclease [Psychrobacter sanguinis]UEC25867.1 Rne/Rng family ribonuclease [Psychrobacter sanguinis]
MSEELLINVSPMESRVAVLDNGVVSEVYIERHNKLGLVGNIYLGTVVRVLPGMQAAFVEIGQSRTAFLHVNDMRRLPRPTAVEEKSSEPRHHTKQEPRVLTSMPVDRSAHLAENKGQGTHNVDSIVHDSGASILSHSVDSTMSSTAKVEVEPTGLREKQSALADESANLQNDLIDNGLSDSSVVEKNLFEADSPDKVGNAITQADTKPVPVKERQIIEPPRHELIQYRLHEGQKILVQVTKDQLGTKGARLTTNISLPSRYLVYLPSSEHIGISQRIDNEEERLRLKTELAQLMQTVNLTGGLIARTAAERVPVAKLEEDIYYLVQLWRTIQARKEASAGSGQSAVLIYQELSLPLRSIRDLVHPDTEKVIVDHEGMYNEVRQFAKEFVPFIYSRILPYMGEQPLFDVHRVEEDLRDALKRRVDLKSGGYLIIDQTEAMTTIDVNTGSFVGGRSLEDTVYKTNLEATHAIARQLRLRNLGGIIILDFIDMLEQEHKDDVLQSLQQQLSQDYAKTKITQVSELGLVEMTRKRTRESLEQQLCEPCKTCEGKGFIKTAETVCFEIFREIMRCARTYNSPKKFTVVAHASVIDLLLSSEADTVADLEYLLGRVITFEVENLYTQEQYDIVLD